MKYKKRQRKVERRKAAFDRDKATVGGLQNATVRRSLQHRPGSNKKTG